MIVTSNFSIAINRSYRSYCHVERSETSLTISARQEPTNIQRSFATLRMTTRVRRPPRAHDACATTFSLPLKIQRQLLWILDALLHSHEKGDAFLSVHRAV